MMMSQSYEYAMPRHMYENCNGLDVMRDPTKIYEDGYLLDVYMGCYKQMQMSMRTANGQLVLREFLEHTEAFYRIKKTFYELPNTHQDVYLNHSIYTYGLFVVKAPEIRTESETVEMENPSLERMIRDRYGNIIDTLDNHLFERYLYVGRFKPNELVIDCKKDKMLFSKVVQQPCGCFEPTLIAGYQFPPNIEYKKANVILSPTRNLTISIPRIGRPKEKYVIDHVTRKLLERDGLSNPNENWTFFTNEELYKMTLLYAFAFDNEHPLDATGTEST